MTARSTLFRCRTPETPNHISVSTARDVASPSDIPMSKMDRVFTEETPFEVVVAGVFYRMSSTVLLIPISLIVRDTSR